MEEHIVKPIISSIPPVQKEERKEEVSVVQDKGASETKEAPNEEKKSVWDSNRPLQDPYLIDDPIFFKVSDYFGLNARAADFNKNKILDIVEWGRSGSPTKDDGDVLMRIKDLEKTLNILPGMAEQRHTILHRYIILVKQKQHIEKEMGVWENYGN